MWSALKGEVAGRTATAAASAGRTTTLPSRRGSKGGRARASDLEEMEEAEASIFGGADTPLNLGEGEPCSSQTRRQTSRAETLSQEALAKACTETERGA